MSASPLPLSPPSVRDSQAASPTAPRQAPRGEIRLEELDEKQLLAGLSSVVLNPAAWSCFSISETSRLLRPLQICPDLTGTPVLSPGATAEVVYKFLLSDGRIGTMKGLISIEDFRSKRLHSIYEELRIEEIIPVFNEAVVVQIIDQLKPVFARDLDELLWQESFYFTPQDLRQPEFLLRGLRPEAIPRRFRPHLQRVYSQIMRVCRSLPNIAFQLCLRAYLEYNEVKNKHLLAILLSKYFYTLYRIGGLDGWESRDPVEVGSLCSGDRRARLQALSHLLTLDNDSDEPLASLGGPGPGGSYFSGEGELAATEVPSAEAIEKLRQDVEAARSQAAEAQQLVAQYQEEKKQELLNRLQDPNKFLLFSLHQFFDTLLVSLPAEVKSEYGAAWVPRTSYLDEKERDKLTQHLHWITSETYLLSIPFAEATIIGYWRVLADSFYNQWVLNQYKQLQSYGVDLEQQGIQILEREQFLHEVQLRFAARHLEIVTQNVEKISQIVVDSLAKRVALNTSQQSFQAMRAKLTTVLDMDISRKDMGEVKRLIDYFTDVFLGKREELRSPYPVGTILQVRAAIEACPPDSRTRIGLEILNQIYREYMPVLQQE
ncbi:hypothetical protein NW852_05700 [Synechococcus sp. H60.1]|uniref:hypothetical protein n=1 Tax=Synechococcus sp. H60.1 TaxID=2964517 RepID=UPI0039C3831A